MVAINSSYDKANIYFRRKFTKEIEEKTKNIKEENIIEPKPSIVGPAMQGLSYAHEEENLKEMYTSLIAGAMNKEKADDIHPAFVEIIWQLTANEALNLKILFKNNTITALAKIYLKNKNTNGKQYLYNHLIDIYNNKNNVREKDINFPVMIDNWIRLGLVEVDYQSSLTDKDAYLWVDKRPEMIDIRNEYINNKDIEIGFTKGVMKITSFGMQFSKSIGI